MGGEGHKAYTETTKERTTYIVRPLKFQVPLTWHTVRCIMNATPYLIKNQNESNHTALGLPFININLFATKQVMWILVVISNIFWKFLRIVEAPIVKKLVILCLN